MTKFVEITIKNIREGFYINKDGAIVYNRGLKSGKIRCIYDPANNKFASLISFIEYYGYSKKDREWLINNYPGITFVSQEVIDTMENRQRRFIPPKHYIRCNGKKLSIEQYSDQINKGYEEVCENLNRYGSGNVEDYYSLRVDSAGNNVAIISEDSEYSSSIYKYLKKQGFNKPHNISTKYITDIFDYAEGVDNYD